MKVDKKELILESIIKSYLLENSPIGSNELNTSLCIPASTIRLYLKKLDDEGTISKIHLSSGRVPTIKTMQNYWIKHLGGELDKTWFLNADFLLELSKEFELYAIVYGGRDLILNEIFNLNNKFIVMDFKENEIAIKHQKQAYEFLKTLIGLDLFSIEALALRVKFFELCEKISALKQSLLYFRTNEKRAYQIYQNDEFAKLLNADINLYFKSNLEFEPLFRQGFMGLKMDAKFESLNVNVVVAGSVYTDFEKILYYIKEAW